MIDTRQARHYEKGLNESLGEPVGTKWESVTRRVEAAGEGARPASVPVAVSAQLHKPAGLPYRHLMLVDHLPSGLPLDL